MILPVKLVNKDIFILFSLELKYLKLKLKWVRFKNKSEPW